MRSLPVLLCIGLLSGCPGGPEQTDGGPDGGGAAEDGGGGNPPTGSIYDVYPRDGATGLWRYTDLLVEFAQPMQQNTVQVVFEPPPAQAFSRIWDGNTLNLSPGFATTLNADTQYRATVSGKTTSGANVGYSWSFRTRAAYSDTEAPSVTTVPADGGTEVAVDAHVVFRFSEPVVPAYSTLQTYREPLGDLRWNESHVELDVAPPPGGWIPGSTNALVLTTEDIAANNLEHTLVFSVAEPVAPLEVLGISPPPGADVPEDARVSISFSRDMEPTSTAAAITLTPSNGCSAASDWVNPRMFRCSKSAFLEPGTTYTLTVGTGATDAKGNSLGAPFSASFTGQTLSDSIAPTLVSSSPGPDQRGVLDGTPLVVRFSEPMDRASVEEGFEVRGNGLKGRFGWNPDSTELTYVPTEHYSPGFTTEWNINTARDIGGMSNNLGPSQYWSLGVDDWFALSLRGRTVTVGSSGSRTTGVTLMMIGDDARNQARATFLAFQIDDLSGGFTTVTSVRTAQLLLRQLNCEGNSSALGALQIETVDPGEVIDALDLTTAPTGPVMTVESPCSASRDLFTTVTPLVQAAFAARATNGGTLHLRLRYLTPSNNDHQPDRMVFNSAVGLSGPELRGVYEYGAGN